MGVIIYPYWDLSSSMLVKGALDDSVSRPYGIIMALVGIMGSGGYVNTMI